MANTSVRSRENNNFRKRVTMLTARISYADLGAREAGDRVECFLIPPGSVVSRYWIDVATVGDGTLDIGYAADSDALKTGESIETAGSRPVNTGNVVVTGNQPLGVQFAEAQTNSEQYDFTLYVELVEPDSTVGLPLEKEPVFNSANSGNS